MLTTTRTKDPSLAAALLVGNAAHLARSAAGKAPCVQCGWPLDNTIKLCALCGILYENVHERQWFQNAQREFEQLRKEDADRKRRLMEGGRQQ